MTELVQTHLLTPESIAARSISDRDQIYNALDCCVTFEVLEALQRFSNQVPVVYDFERGLQAPLLEMMLRGVRVNSFERDRALEALRAIVQKVDARLQRFAHAIWDKPLNPNSPKQLIEFFYKHLHLPEIYISEKGVRRLSMNREVLEKLQHHYLAMPIISAILTIREHTKSIQTLETEVDPDMRIRSSFNMATETGRLSSSKNAFGTGGNMQNWKERNRKPLEADKGWKILAIDKEQAESRELGLLMGVLFDDWTYLNACEGGDLHTFSARLVWPELPWTGDPKKDRAIAECADGKMFYRDFTYRDMSKRGGHGTNYVGTPWTMARHLKVPVKVMEVFSERYFRAFPAIPRLHTWTAGEIQTTHQLCTYFGRVRHFFGRANDEGTLREGVAFMGQSPTADCTNLGMYKVWDTCRDRLRLLQQLHDACYWQYREDDNEEEVVALALKTMEVHIVAPSGRKFCVPGEAKVGWNFSRHHDETKPCDHKTNPFNPNGLKKFRGKDTRKRLEGMDTPL